MSNKTHAKTTTTPTVESESATKREPPQSNTDATRRAEETRAARGAQPWTSAAELAAVARGAGELAGPNGERIVRDGPAQLITGVPVSYQVEGGDESTACTWYCVNDLSHQPNEGEVYNGPSKKVWQEAQFGFAGNHIIVCQVSHGSETFGLAFPEIVRTPKEQVAAAAASSEPVDFESLQAGLYLQEAMATEGAMTLEGMAIAASAPNPAPLEDKELKRMGSFWIKEAHAETHSIQWHATCSDWSVMGDGDFDGHARGDKDGAPAYNLGGGDIASGALNASFPLTVENTYTIISEELNEAGKVVRRSEYIQGVVSEEKAEAIDGLRAHQATVGELGGKLEGRTPLTAAYVNTESGTTTALNLFLGSDTESGKPMLLDLTPGVPRREYSASSRDDLIELFEDRNSYPAGLIQLRGELGSHELETDGASTWSEWSSATGWASLGLAVVGGIATLTGVGATVGVPMLIAAGATGAASAGLSLAERLTHQELDSLGVAIDLVSIVTSVLTGGLAARGASVVTNGARYALYADVAGTGIEATLIGVQYAEGIDAILASDMDGEQKRTALLRLGAVAVAQGAMVAIGTNSSVQAIKAAPPASASRSAATDLAAAPTARRGDNATALRAQDEQSRQAFLDGLHAGARGEASKLSVADLRTIYPEGDIPRRLGDLASISGFALFAKQNPEHMRRLADGLHLFGGSDRARRLVDKHGWLETARAFSRSTPRSEPSIDHADYLTTRGGNPELQPDVRIQPTGALDHNGAFMQGTRSGERTDTPSYRVVRPSQLVVGGEPLGSMSGVLIFSGHGSPRGFTGTPTEQAAKMAAREVFMSRGAIRYVVLDACNQRNARWLFGGSNAQAFQKELRRLLDERGVDGDSVTVLAASKAGPTFSDGTQRSYVRGRSSDAEFTPADDGSRAYVDPEVIKAAGIGAAAGTGALAVGAGAVATYYALEEG